MSGGREKAALLVVLAGGLIALARRQGVTEVTWRNPDTGGVEPMTSSAVAASSIGESIANSIRSALDGQLRGGAPVGASIGAAEFDAGTVVSFPSQNARGGSAPAASGQQIRTPDAGAPRGIRNNNPGNIEWSASQTWQGQVGSDGRFIIFSDAHWGLRALARLLSNYRRLHGLTTVQGLIGRWAPSGENNTSAYVSAVASAVGVRPNQELTFAGDQFVRLVAAIVQHENGQQPYTTAQIRAGINAA